MYFVYNSFPTKKRSNQNFRSKNKKYLYIYVCWPYNDLP